jgi:hypothetical protein
MADWPTLYGDCTRAQTLGQDYAATRGTAVVSSATAHVKGNWAPIAPAASCTFDAQGLIICIELNTAAKGLFDIGIGATPSVLVPNLMVQGGYPGMVHVIHLPLAIPASQDLTVRWQSDNAAATTAYVTMTFISQGFLAPAGLNNVETLGALTGTTSGTLIPCNATTSNDKPGTVGNPTWITLGTLVYPCSALLFLLGNMKVSRSAAKFMLNIALNDTINDPPYFSTHIFTDLMLQVNTGYAGFAQAVLGPFPRALPAGSVVRAIAQCDSIVLATRQFHLVAYAFG